MLYKDNNNTLFNIKTDICHTICGCIGHFEIFLRVNIQNIFGIMTRNSVVACTDVSIKILAVKSYPLVSFFIFHSLIIFWF